VFYGWYVLGVAVLGALLSTGLSQMFFSIMLKPITEELGWSRTALSGVATAGTIVAGLASAPIGPLADRYGPRVLGTLGALYVGLTYFAISHVTELWQFYLVYVAGRAVSGVTLTGVVPNTAAANWFRRMRGRALGLISAAIPFGGAVLAFGGQWIIDAHGWRTVYLVLCAAVFTLFVLPSAIVMRRRPEDVGLLPDGDQAPPGHTGSTAPPRASVRSAGDEASWTRREAMRTPALWLITAAGTIAIAANSGVSFHQVAYYTDVGLPTTTAVASLAIYALAGAAAVAFWGFLTERLPERNVAMVVMFVSAAATLYLLTVRSAAGALVFAILFGLTSRGEGALLNIILAQYFGRASFGAISGFVHPFQMVGLGLGPMFSSICFDLTGSYQIVFVLYAGVSMLAVGLLWLARKPVHPVPREVAK
jgi:sugar phosphate permease